MSGDSSALAEVVGSAKVVVCCGSGGVGKTTIAAVIALAAARGGRRSVVVTIDPARRLADALGIESLSNTPSRIDLGGDPGEAPPGGSPGGLRGEMHALMLDTKSTFDGLVRRYSTDAEQAERILANRFYENISSALSGTQEYMASEKLYELAAEGDWDLVVVDTPPTRHALDFLDAPQRLANFLDHRLYRILMTPTRGLVKAVNVAAQTVVRSLSKVVGSDVVADAIEFFGAFEGMEDGFKERAAAVDDMLGSGDTAFVLVASPKADTVAEAGYFASRLAEHEIDVRALVVNRMQPRFDTVADSPGAVEARERAATLAGTAIGDHYRALADAATMADGEESHLVGLADQVAPAPVIRVPVLPVEVTDLAGLSRLAELLFEEAPEPPSAE